MMIMRPLLLSLSVFTLSACTPGVSVNSAIELNGQYWQRVSASSTIYTRGPKAQQMLNRDISRCVVELRELERLGEIHDAIPKYIDEGRILSEDEAKLAGIDSPERDQELYSEQSDYHDFEGCMYSKGWERIKYVPYDIAQQSRENYLKNHSEYRDSYGKMTGLETGDESLPSDDYDDLNQ